MTKEHDYRYKKLFSNPILIQELLQSFVKEKFINELDFSTLERLDKSFVTDKFKEKESDLIYKINFKGNELYIYLLIEFQSTVDKFMSLRMLRYICEFYEFIIQRKVKELPPVFPILLYNGDAKWTAKTRIKDLIIGSIPDKYIPDFRYYPIIENEFSMEALLKIKNAVSAIFFIENISTDRIHEEFKKIVNLIEKEQPEIITLFRNWINNFLGYRNASVNETISDLEEEKEMFATTIKKYSEKIKKEGLQQGMQQGIQQGQKKKALETAVKMLSKGYSIKEITELTGLTRPEVEKLRK